MIQIGKIEKSYTEGEITSSGTRVGGLVGWNGYEIKNCYSTASVEGSSNVGGLVGNNYDSIYYSYAIGKVTATETTSTVGGLVGNGSDTIYDSYWDKQTTGQTKERGGTGYSTTEMQTRSSYSSSWDFNKVWKWVDGDYPKLQ